MSLMLCLCSALSKEIGITAVAIFIVYEFFILNKVELLDYCVGAATGFIYSCFVVVIVVIVGVVFT